MATTPQMKGEKKKILAPWEDVSTLNGLIKLFTPLS